MDRDFWRSSWERVDRSRVAACLAAAEMACAPLITLLRDAGAHTVCDAGCGCGALSAALLRAGFAVSGFDTAPAAVELARAAAPGAALKTADVCDTGYASGAFDAVVCRDVLDHMPLADARRAAAELLRITRPGGLAVFTVDAADEEYDREIHTLTADGDRVYTAGKWAGMVFHAYDRAGLAALIPAGAAWELREDGDDLTVLIRNRRGPL